MVLRDGILLYAQPGALPERALDQLRHDHGLLVVGIICWAKVTSAACRSPTPRAGLPVAAAAGGRRACGRVGVGLLAQPASSRAAAAAASTLRTGLWFIG
jgi:hypothetical protein